MIQQSAFRLDCTPLIPACGFECSKCIEEMRAVFGKSEGVRKFYMEGDGVVVHHDPDVIPVEQIMAIFKSLPSFHEGHFVPYPTKP
jgi:hypothetical protein